MGPLEDILPSLPMSRQDCSYRINSGFELQGYDSASRAVLCKLLSIYERKSRGKNREMVIKAAAAVGRDIIPSGKHLRRKNKEKIIIIFASWAA